MKTGSPELRRENVYGDWALAVSLSLVTSASLLFLVLMLTRLQDPGMVQGGLQGDGLTDRAAEHAYPQGLPRSPPPAHQVTSVACLSTLGTPVWARDMDRSVRCSVMNTPGYAATASHASVPPLYGTRSLVLIVGAVLGWLLSMALLARPPLVWRRVSHNSRRCRSYGGQSHYGIGPRVTQPEDREKQK
jgi:hypothetical protein